MLKVLVDSSFLFALFFGDDPDHLAVRRVFVSTPAAFIIPQIVLTEAAFLFNREGGMPLVVMFLDLLSQAEVPLEPVTYADLKRASQILKTYRGAKLELVDCCLVAIAERLNIAHIATLDRRDFAILRKNDGSVLTILP
jgi:hypothetical protein